MDSKLNICILGQDIRHACVLDMEYLSRIFNIKRFDINWDGELGTIQNRDTLQWILNNNIDVIVSQHFDNWSNNEQINQFFDKIKLHPNTKDIPIVLLHVMFPRAREIPIEENIRNGFIYLTDFATNHFDNCIEVPLLGILNFDTINFHQTNGHRMEKQFLSSQFEDIYEREYDVKFKIGKPKPVRVLTALMLLKHDLHNFYTNISYSKETSYCGTYDDVINDLRLLNTLPELGLAATLARIIDKHELSNYFDKIKIESYLGAANGKTKIKYQTEERPDIGYTADFNAYAEAYTESETCTLSKNKTYPNLVCFTEKSFTTFFYYKIPLAVDTKSNIDYLKKIGFQFPINPCIIEPTETLDSLAIKLEEWCVYLKTFDFKELWNKWYYTPNLDESPLRQNHQLIYELMHYNNAGNLMSIPQYNSTYKFIEKLFPDKLEDYKNWDNPKYRFLTKRGLL
jgi:hypothetical protein